MDQANNQGDMSADRGTQRGGADAFFSREESTIGASARRMQPNKGRATRRTSIACQISPKRRDSDVKIHTAFSMGAVHRVFSTFKGEKVDIVNSIGLGGLLKIHPQSRLTRLLVLSLVRSMDPITGTIRLANGEELPVTEEDIVLVLGLPRSTKMIKCGIPATQSDVAKVKGALMIKRDKEITLGYLEKLLVKDYGLRMTTREREAFKIAALLYADAYFLAPKGQKAKVNQEVLKCLTDPAGVESFNWCAYVLRVLVNSARKVQEALRIGEQKVTLDGCLFFWVVYYIDNVEFGPSNCPHNVVPRVVDFPYRIVQDLVGDDKCKSDVAGAKNFGLNKLRPSNEVIYSRNRENKYMKEKIRNVIEIQFDTKVLPVDARGSDGGEIISSILESWARDVNSATIAARDELITVLKKGGSTPGAERYVDEDIAISKSAEQNYINIESDDDVTNGDENGGENPRSQVEDTVAMGTAYEDEIQASNHNEEEAACASIRQNVLREQPYSEDLLITRLSGLDLMDPNDEIDRRNKNSETGPGEVRPNEVGMELVTVGDMGMAELGGEGDEINSPMPLCVVRYTATNSETSALELEDGNYISEDDYDMQHNEKFGLSPFTLNIAHKDAPLHCQVRLEKAIMALCDEDKQRTWYRHNLHPKIEISGEFLKKMFTGTYDLTMSAINGIVRLFNDMDDEIYENWRQKRWRHFLPVEFAVISLNGLNNEKEVQLEELARMFVGGGVNYNVGECRLVLAPLMVEWCWCLYAWDFERNAICVLDPMVTNAAINTLEEKHRYSVSLMHEAMCECRRRFFPEKDESDEVWETKFVTITGGGCQSYESGVYTMFSARYFDGYYITRILTKSASRLQKMNILWQMLSMKANDADPPAEAMEEMQRRLGV